MGDKNNYPPGWDESRVKRVIEHYGSQNEYESLAEDETTRETPGHTFMEVPNELVPVVRELIAKQTACESNV